MKLLQLLSGGIPLFQSDNLIAILSALSQNQELWQSPPRVTQQLPTKQPRRKTGIAQARRIARKRRNRK